MNVCTVFYHNLHLLPCGPSNSYSYSGLDPSSRKPIFYWVVSNVRYKLRLSTTEQITDLVIVVVTLKETAHVMSGTSGTCDHLPHIFICTAHKVSELDKQKEEEAKILHSIKEASALMSVSELAKGVVYTEPLVTGSVHPHNCEAVNSRG